MIKEKDALGDASVIYLIILVYQKKRAAMPTLERVNIF